MISIKICGLTNLDDARWAMEEGADYLGFVLYPKSPRCVTASGLSRIVASLPDTARRIGVFVNESPALVRKVAGDCGLTAVQLHGDEDDNDYRGFGLPVWRAVRLEDEAWVPEPARWRAERYVIDAFSSEYGGTGLTADWDKAEIFAARYRSMLAGGLHSGNVAEAIRRVSPLGVDVSSGVESAPGKKDHKKITAFIRTVRDAEEGCLTGSRDDTKGKVI